MIVMKPAEKEPLEDGEERFRQMNRLKDDDLLISDNLDSDMKEWEW
jgi:hypothetical protein